MSVNRRLIRIALWIAVIATAVMIFCFSAETREESAETSDGITLLVIRLFDPAYDSRPPEEQMNIFGFTGQVVRKCAHFSEFALLGFFLKLLLTQYMEKRTSRLSWGIGTLYAMTDEAHQVFVDERSGSAVDMLIDSCGVMAGALVAWALLTLIARARGGKQA